MTAAAARSRRRDLCARVPGAGVAVALRRRDDPVRRQVDLLSAGRVHGARIPHRRIAVLDAERLRRLAEYRRPAVDARSRRCMCCSRLASAAPGLRANDAVTFAYLFIGGLGDHPLFPRPRLACGGRAGRGARVRVRRRRERAAAAHRTGDQPLLSAAGAVAAGARARSLIRGLGRCLPASPPR